MMEEEYQLVQPAEPVTTSIARIFLEDDGRISVFFPEKRDGFRECVKDMGFAWGGEMWQRQVEVAVQQDRAAEMVHRLLKAGYRVKAVPAVVQAAVQQTYTPEPRRMVMVAKKGRYAGWFRVWWWRSEDCYDIAKRLPGSQYRSTYRDVVVPPESFAAVQEFAEMHQFVVSEDAQQLVVTAEAEWESALVVELEPEPERKTGPAKRPVLAVPDTVDIDPALLDEWEEEGT